MHQTTVLIIGIVGALVLALGIIGALVARSDAEVRKRRMRAVRTTIIVVVVVLGAAFLFTPATTAKAFDLFTVPVAALAAGVGVFTIARWGPFGRVGGVLADIVRGVLVLGALALGILGLVLGVRAYLAW